MNLGSWLARQAQVYGDRPALFLGEKLVADYGTFHDRAARLAGWLGALGVAPGDRVALFMKNCPDYLIALYAVWYAGAAAVPINAKLHGREAAFILENSDAALAFTTAATGGCTGFGSQMITSGYSAGGQAVVFATLALDEAIPDVTIVREFSQAGPYNLASIPQGFLGVYIRSMAGDCCFCH